MLEFLKFLIPQTSTKLYNLELGSEFDPLYDELKFAYSKCGQPPLPPLCLAEKVRAHGFEAHLKRARQPLINVQRKGGNPKIPLYLGRLMEQEGSMLVDLQDLPHIIMAGATGQGKSIFIYNMLLSNFMFSHPSYLKIICMDGTNNAFTDMAQYNIATVVEADGISAMMKRVSKEADRRTAMLKEKKVQDILHYNKQRNLPHNKLMPFLVIYFDEFQTFAISGMKEKRETYNKLLELIGITRKLGIHFIFSTQAAYSKVVGFLAKSNMPAKISFGAATPQASRVILDNKKAFTDLDKKGEVVRRGGGGLHKFIKFVQRDEMLNSLPFNTILCFNKPLTYQPAHMGVSVAGFFGEFLSRIIFVSFYFSL